jgi:arsenate reductase
MSVTIWHNPKCATSLKVLEAIRASGVEPKIVDYVNAPPSVGAIKAALKAMAMKPRGLLRRRGTPYDELGLGNEDLSDASSSPPCTHIRF